MPASMPAMTDLDERSLYTELGRRGGVSVDAGTRLVDVGLDSVQWLDFAGWLAERGFAVTPQVFAAARTAGELRELLAAPGSAALPAAGPVERPDPVDQVAPSGVADPAGFADPGPASTLLVGPTFELTPVDPQAMSFLYHLAVSSEVGYRWRFRGSVPNFETFEATLWHGTLCQFVAVERASGRPCGHVICYNPEFAHGYGSVAAVFVPEHLGTGAGLQCVGSFVRYVFTVWPMRKLYLEVPSFNYPQFAAGEGRLFVEEGRLTAHDYYAGRYWDRHVLAVYRRHANLAPIEPPALSR